MQVFLRHSYIGVTHQLLDLVHIIALSKLRSERMSRCLIQSDILKARIFMELIP